MSEQIIFDAAINRIAAGAQLSESDKSALRQELQIAALLHELKVYPKNSHTPYDFNNVHAQTYSLKFGNLECSTVKTSDTVVLKTDINNWLKENRKPISFRLKSTTDTLFDTELSGRDFGSLLLHVPELLKWIASKGLHVPIPEPTIKKYKFVQVESLFCAIETALCASLDPEESLTIASNHSEHHNHAAVTNQNAALAKWLLTAHAAHVTWKTQIVAAINNRELTLLDYPSLLPINPEALKVLLASLPEVNSSSASYAGQVGEVQTAAEPLQARTENKAKPLPVALTEQSVDDEIASLFDGVGKQQLAAMFSVNQDATNDLALWTGYIKQANKNELEKARTSHGKYNPYKAGLWWLDTKKQKGWTLERLNKRLAKNLPERSKGNESRLTGEEYN